MGRWPIALGWPYVSARVRMFKEAREVRGRIVDRLDADAALVRAELETAAVTVAQRATLRARLVEVSDAIKSIARPELARFTTVLPLNRTHAEILAVHGAMLAATGLPAVVVWKTHRYDAVPLLAVPSPPTEAVAPVDIVVMCKCARRLLVTNATDEQTQSRCLVGRAGSPRRTAQRFRGRVDRHEPEPWRSRTRCLTRHS
jgi:hypothetical protein